MNQEEKIKVIVESLLRLYGKVDILTNKDSELIFKLKDMLVEEK